MKIGLASYEFINNNMEFNVLRIEKAMKAAQGKADILCFGETFLQGFDCLSWDYEKDKHIAAESDSAVIQRLCRMTEKYGVDLLFGYVEKFEDSIYSSCAVIEKGELIYNYRRISKGWKEYSITDEHYKEGTAAEGFQYHGHNIKIALCGDMWDFPERFKTDDLLIWSIYVNFSLDEWGKYETEYAEQAALASKRVLMVNSISEKPKAHGGSFYFLDGKIEEKLDFDREDILIVDI